MSDKIKIFVAISASQQDFQGGTCFMLIIAICCSPTFGCNIVFHTKFADWSFLQHQMTALTPSYMHQDADSSRLSVSDSQLVAFASAWALKRLKRLWRTRKDTQFLNLSRSLAMKAPYIIHPHKGDIMNLCASAAVKMRLQIIDIAAILLHSSHQEQSHLIGLFLRSPSTQLFPVTVGTLITAAG